MLSAREETNDEQAMLICKKKKCQHMLLCPHVFSPVLSPLSRRAGSLLTSPSRTHAFSQAAQPSYEELSLLHVVQGASRTRPFS
jgi:hypothetical protein